MRPNRDFRCRKSIYRKVLGVEKLESRQMMATNIGAVRLDNADPNKLLQFLLDTDPLTGTRDADQEIRFNYGHSSATPNSSGSNDFVFAGDWGGLGFDQVGVARNNPGLGAIQFLLDTDRDIHAEYAFKFGLPGDRPVAGNFDGVNADDIGVTRREVVDGVAYKRWFLSFAKPSPNPFPRPHPSNDPMNDTTVDVSATFVFGLDSDEARVGDFNGDGYSDIAVIRKIAGENVWLIRFARPGAIPFPSNDSCGSLCVDDSRTFGTSTGIPIVGDWDNSGTDDLGVIATIPTGPFMKWTLQSTPNIELIYGLQGDQFIVGNWPNRVFDGGPNGTQTNWNLASSWSEDIAPLAGDSVGIDQPGGDLSISYSGADLPVASVYSNENLDIVAGKITLGNKSKLNGVNVSGGGLDVRSNFQANAFSMSSGQLNLGSTGLNVAGDLNLSGGSLTVAAGIDVTLTNGILVSNSVGLGGNGILRLNGPIFGPGTIEKIGINFMQLFKQETFQGATLISQGEVLLANPNLIPDTSNLFVASGAQLNLAQNAETVAAISGGGSIFLGTGGAILTTSSNNDSTFSGAISGSGSFVKRGNGALTLAGNSTYSGNAQVTSGTLIVNGSLPASNTLTVESGAVLKGIGTVGPTTVNGTISPGTSPGILRTGNLQLGSGSILLTEIGGQFAGNNASNYDQVAVTGTVTIAPTAQLSALSFNDYVPAYRASFAIVLNDGIDPVTGTFWGLPEGSEILNFSNTGVTASISYRGGDGNDIVITVTNVAPSCVAVSQYYVRDSAPVGTLVGQLASVDPDITSTFSYSLVTGTGDSSNSKFIIDSQGNLRTNEVFIASQQSMHSIRVQSKDQGNLQFSQTFEIRVLRADEASIDNRQLYHKGSAFSANGSNVQAALDNGKFVARSTGCTQPVSFSNLSNTVRGLNGLVLDIQNLGASSLTPSDFVFRVSPTGLFNEATNPPSSWGAAPAPSSISVTPGTSTTPSRVRLEWEDNAIANRWLQLQVIANANTRLPNTTVFYFGHLQGEVNGQVTGNAFFVTTQDQSAVLPLGQANVSNPRDLDKNGFITTQDLTAVRNSITLGRALRAITIPASGSANEGAVNGGLSLMANDRVTEDRMLPTVESESKFAFPIAFPKSDMQGDLNSDRIEVKSTENPLTTTNQAIVSGSLNMPKKVTQSFVNADNVSPSSGTPLAPAKRTELDRPKLVDAIIPDLRP